MRYHSPVVRNTFNSRGQMKKKCDGNEAVLGTKFWVLVLSGWQFGIDFYISKVFLLVYLFFRIFFIDTLSSTHYASKILAFSTPSIKTKKVFFTIILIPSCITAHVYMARHVFVVGKIIDTGSHKTVHVFHRPTTTEKFPVSSRLKENERILCRFFPSEN